MIQPQSFECKVGDRILTVNTGKLAGQAGGAVTVRYGDTMVLVTACTSSKLRVSGQVEPVTGTVAAWAKVANPATR